jgi:Ca-activated chloride channel family protein
MLGVRRAATQEEIRHAYLKAVQRLHPDKNVNPGETEIFLEVQQAYETLGNPQRRALYDATLPPEPEPPPAPIEIDIQYSRASLPRLSEPQVIYILMTVAAAPSLADAPAPPLNLCLVLDVSTSMQGEKLEILKETALQLVRRLRPQDTFSLVAFSDRAQVYVPPTQGSEARRAESKIHMLQAGGGTEIFRGLEAGVQEIRRSLRPGTSNHVILLTDGRTYGDEGNCLELAATASTEAIGISGLGIGGGWNDAFLDSLAARAGGACVYAADPQDMTRLLLARFDQLSEGFASETSLNFRLGAGLTLNYVFRLQPEPAPLASESPLSLGGFRRHEPLRLLLELHLPELTEAADQLTLLEGQLSASTPALSAASASVPVRVERPISAEANPEPPAAAIIQALSRVTLYRMQERARLEVHEGNLDRATERLRHLATHLLSQGQQGLAHTVLLEMEHIEKEKSFSEKGEKDIKFGTRGLIGPEKPA